MLGVLGHRCAWLGPDEREAVFHDAFAVMLEKQRDGTLDVLKMHSNQVRAYLTQTAINKALNEGTRAERNRTEPIGERALAEPDFSSAPEEAAAATLESALVREIVDELPERRQAVIKLRFFFERTPAEVQQQLGISARVYRRELERGIRHICQRFELVQAGHFCETREPLIVAYVAGTATDEEAGGAREHLAHCLGCARWAAQLREAARDVAAVLPALPLAAEGRGGSRLAEAVNAVHDAAAQVVAGAKQHAAALAARLDPSAAGYATGARPGTIAAVVAGCIAVGGGATYCAVEGVNDVRGLFGPERGKAVERDRRPAAPKGEDRRQRPALNAAGASASAAEAKARPTPPPARRRAPDPQADQEAAVGAEFGYEESAGQAPAPAPPPPTSSPTLGAGVGAGDPGEFDP